MYHYVRPEPEGLPYFRYLHVEHFRAQLDYIGEEFGFVGREGFTEAVATGRPVDGAVLTFDDAFIDHYEYVLPLLSERDLWGIFYVPTAIYASGKVLDVHRTHILIGRFGGVRCLELLRQVADDSVFPDAAIEEFRTRTYTRQSNDEATLLFKRMLNFYVSYEHRNLLLDQLMEFYLNGEPETELVERTYMTTGHLRELVAAGGIVGSHGVNHLVMSKLDLAQQEAEIRESFEYLARAAGQPVETFCYPHGGFHTFTRDTERLLSEAGAIYSFNVEQRDISARDLRDRPQALPRYDCNQFPFGKASMGADLAPAF